MSDPRPAPSLSLDPVQAGARITRDDLRWGGPLGAPATVTVAFRQTGPGYPDAPASATRAHDVAATFSEANAAQMVAARLALDLWSDVANIGFQWGGDGSGYGDGASILIGDYADPADGAGAFTYFPGSTAPAAADGDVWVNASYPQNLAPSPGGYGFDTLMHEFGHSIGLEHPGDYNAAPGVAITYANSAAYLQDSLQYTIMSYFPASETGATTNGLYPLTPLLDDIAAAQRLYGANTGTRTGDTTYGFNSNADRSAFHLSSATQGAVFAIWDAGGFNTLDMSGYAQNQVLDLNAGAFSSTGGLVNNVAIALGTVVQGAVGGSGDDTIVLNDAGDRVDGGGGDDTAVFDGAASDFRIDLSGGVATVTDERAGHGEVDTLTRVGHARFTDATVDLGPAAAQLGFSVADGTASTTLRTDGSAYVGPVAGLQHQFIDLTPDNLAIASAMPNAFIRTGAGDDAIDVSAASGDNVLDGGTGSNFLVGGAGRDTFFLDDRGPTAATWSTVANFHGGDDATVWGITAAGASISWTDGMGANGYKGLTAVITAPGKPQAMLTLAGYTAADLGNGRLSVGFGRLGVASDPSGTDYMLIHAT